jgi:brefeldin A-resistance guanine nucleotide exchange factor 1
MSSRQAATLLLNHEIASVITAMRHNAKWAMVPRYYVSETAALACIQREAHHRGRSFSQEEDCNEPSKYDDAFRELRAEIFKYHGKAACWIDGRNTQVRANQQQRLVNYADWREVDPMTYLSPFLNLIKASDVSGPITGAAAVALQRILTSDLLGKLRDDDSRPPWAFRDADRTEGVGPQHRAPGTSRRRSTKSSRTRLSASSSRQTIPRTKSCC